MQRQPILNSLGATALGFSLIPPIYRLQNLSQAMESSDSRTPVSDNSHKTWEDSDAQTSVLDNSHPPAPKSPRFKQLAPWFLLTAVLFLGGGFAWRFLTQNRPPEMAQQPQAFPVGLKRVESSTIEEKSSNIIGTLEAQKRVTLQPEAAGRITQIFVSAGAVVDVGDSIVQLKPDRSEAELRSAIANVSGQTAALNNARAEARAEEAEVARLKAEVGRQQAELQSRENDFTLAKTNYRRAEQLVSQGVQPEQELNDKTRERDNAIANRDAAIQALQAANEALNVARRRREAAQATEERAAADLSSARANVAVQEEVLQFNRVVAPIAGVVGDIPVKQGDYVNVGDTLTTIIQNQTLELNIRVDEEEIDRLRVGLPVEARRQGASETENPISTGRISFISPQVDNNQQILVKATFDNPENRLQDQQIVNARIIWEKRPGVLIPTTAVSRLAGKPFVFVAQNSEESQPGTPQLIARQKPVTLGSIQDNQYQVLEGVEPGEQIVISGIQNLTDGAPIAPDSPQPDTGSQGQRGQGDK
ncbi:efflux RND transporter periplasmic adaptor subunit, partial [Coleofasciculus sp. LEGE 07081]